MSLTESVEWTVRKSREDEIDGRVSSRIEKGAKWRVKF
jgi:hypothetical protein